MFLSEKNVEVKKIVGLGELDWIVPNRLRRFLRKMHSSSAAAGIGAIPILPIARLTSAVSGGI